MASPLISRIVGRPFADCQPYVRSRVIHCSEQHGVCCESDLGCARWVGKNWPSTIVGRENRWAPTASATYATSAIGGKAE